jgi:hypothetical protein
MSGVKCVHRLPISGRRPVLTGRDRAKSDGANLTLSRRRADAVRGALVAHHGIDASRLVSRGHGSSIGRYDDEGPIT